MSDGQPKAYPQEEEENFNLTQLFASYVNKPEITALTPSFLVAGSQNVLVDYAQRVISRNGYKLYNQANTGAGGIKGSYEWDTSTGAQFSLRSYDHTIEFDWNSTYNTLLTGLRSPTMEFAKVLDYNESQDVLLFVNGDGGKVLRWGGGVSKVRTSTSNTLIKQGVLTAVTTIAFVAGTPGTIAATITDSANEFLNAGFAAGDTLSIIGSTGNSSNFTIGSVVAGTITLIMSDILVSEAVGQTITMYNQTGPTWKSARFYSTISGRAIVYKGVAYTYTGGETTDTLTGVTGPGSIAMPAVTAGDPVWQMADSFNLPSDITADFPLFYPDLIGMQLNMVFLGSTKSQMIFGSKNDDYTNYALTSPRAAGDPFQEPLTSGNCTCIIPVDTDKMVLNVQNTLIFGSGLDAFDGVDFHMSADNTEELLRIIRYKTAIGSGLISKSAICPIKNNTVYISREPALDSLSEGNLESPDGKKNVPISDPIKNDFDSYDFTAAHIKYWKRSIYVALPAEGLLLVYDMMRNLWQPPQTIPVSRLSIIEDLLYGHSAITNETYQLFVGTDDDGVAIEQIATFAYNNGGMRAIIKNLTEYWSDGYISANAELDYTIFYGYMGALGSTGCIILGNDSSIVVAGAANPLGNAPLGEDPLGGDTLSPTLEFPGAGLPLQRFYQIDTCSPVDYTEHYVQYTMNTLGGQFAIVAHGSNQFVADTALITNKK